MGSDLDQAIAESTYRLAARLGTRAAPNLIESSQSHSFSTLYGSHPRDAISLLVGEAEICASSHSSAPGILSSSGSYFIKWEQATCFTCDEWVEREGGLCQGLALCGRVKWFIKIPRERINVGKFNKMVKKAPENVQNQSQLAL